MRKNSLAFSFLIASMALTVVPALGQTSYKRDDIVKHFAPGVPQLGATRGICTGTEAQCPKTGQLTQPSQVDAFDLVVKFEYNSDVLTASARQNLDEFAEALKDPRLSSSGFLVEGHTDAAGPDTYNQSLSERRAAAVVRYLAGKGVESARLTARGLGESKPRVADPFAGDNRRVETRLRVQ